MVRLTIVLSKILYVLANVWLFVMVVRAMEKAPAIGFIVIAAGSVLFYGMDMVLDMKIKQIRFENGLYYRRKEKYFNENN